MDERQIIVNNEIAYECKKYPNIFVTRSGVIYSIFVKGGRGKTNINKPHKICYGCDKDGYYRIVYSRDGKHEYLKVHTIVVQQFIGEISEGMVVNHKDGNKQNNDISNLEIITSRENTRHAWDTGLANKEQNPNRVSVNVYDNETQKQYHFTSIENTHQAFPILSKRYINYIRNGIINFNLCLFKKVTYGNKQTDYKVLCFYNGQVFDVFKNNKEAGKKFNKPKNSISSAYNTKYPKLVNRYTITFPNVSTIETDNTGVE